MKEQLLRIRKKKLYEPPLVELILLKCTDIITTSDGFENNESGSADNELEEDIFG